MLDFEYEMNHLKKTTFLATFLLKEGKVCSQEHIF